jgi:hypothetical protein
MIQDIDCLLHFPEALIIRTPSILTQRSYETQHDDTRHNDTQHNDTQHEDTQHDKNKF